ncbi:MAG: ATP-binding cassette domain-containing protein, partial [Rhodobacterales bacterium]|nr:ATP-binding cassette domain-containing protein [Rhodobacterales bacterium]
KALYQDVKILVLDEPTAVLTPQEADTLFENIKAMTKDGLSVIFISHKLREVLTFSDRIAVLRHGEKVGEIATSDANERVIARMMVGEDTIENPREKIEIGTPILELNDISLNGDSARTSLNKSNLTIHQNEIVGIAGVSGNGQSVLAKLISGLLEPDSGTLNINGENIKYFSPNEMQSLGVGRIPEDRHHDGVIGAMSVAENLIIERLNDKDINSRGFLQNKEINENAKQLIEKYDIRGPGVDAKASLLSGGNIQKLILARVFECKPIVILANQPTRGLDLGAANEVARRLLKARARGAGILLISEDLDEIIALSDRIIVIHNGSLTEAHNAGREAIGLMMAGESA